MTDAFHDLDRELEGRADLADYWQRSRRYGLLKDWWAAQRRLRLAQRKADGQNRQAAVTAALSDIQGLKDHYWLILKPALEQWDHKDAYLKLCLVIEQDRRMSGQERESLWLNMVIKHAD